MKIACLFGVLLLAASLTGCNHPDNGEVPPAGELPTPYPTQSSASATQAPPATSAAAGSSTAAPATAATSGTGAPATASSGTSPTTAASAGASH